MEAEVGPQVLRRSNEELTTHGHSRSEMPISGGVEVPLLDLWLGERRSF